MKNLILIFIFVSLVGCMNTMPKTQDDIESKISIEHDTFKNQTWISTPLFLSRQGFTDTFPVNIKYRALFEGNELSFIQLYVTKSDLSWGFYHSAVGEDGYEFEFIKVDSNVDSSSSMVTTKEHFALGLSYNYLNKMATKEWKVKVYGKRNEGVFVVPQHLTKAFLTKVNCFQSKECD